MNRGRSHPQISGAPIRAGGAFLAGLLFVGFGCVAEAQTRLPPPPGGPTVARDFPGDAEETQRVQGLFDIDLPKTEPKNRFKIIVHPHLGDLLHRSYLRLPLGVRYGVNDHLELNGEVLSYFTHGLKEGDSLYGLATFRVGGKYEWQQVLREHVRTSTGFNATAPLGRPPPGLTDGRYHVAPYIVFSKDNFVKPGLTTFLTVGTDLQWKSSVPGEVGMNQPRSHSVGVAPGFIYDRQSLKYTLLVGYATTAVLGTENHHFFTVNPSLLWQLPPKLVFNSKIKWIAGFGIRAGWGPDGRSFGTSTKLRGEFRFGFGGAAPFSTAWVRTISANILGREE